MGFGPRKGGGVVTKWASPVWGESNCRTEFVAELGIGTCFAGACVCVVPLGEGVLNFRLLSDLEVAVLGMFVLETWSRERGPRFSGVYVWMCGLQVKE